MNIYIKLFMKTQNIGKSKLQKLGDYSLFCTVPKAVTVHLGVDKGDRIVFLKRGDDYVIKAE